MSKDINSEAEYFAKQVRSIKSIPSPVERAAKALWDHRAKEIRSTGGWAQDWEKLAPIFRIETCIEAETVLAAAGLLSPVSPALPLPDKE